MKPAAVSLVLVTLFVVTVRGQSPSDSTCPNGSVRRHCIGSFVCVAGHSCLDDECCRWPCPDGTIGKECPDSKGCTDAQVCTNFQCCAIPPAPTCPNGSIGKHCPDSKGCSQGFECINFMCCPNPLVCPKVRPGMDCVLGPDSHECTVNKDCGTAGNICCENACGERHCTTGVTAT